MNAVEMENLIYDNGSEIDLYEAEQYFGNMTVIDIIRDAHHDVKA